ncbi:type II toxin-antitoxin system RelE/ParE family toxin [Marinobacterium aestuariivivens]|uniref:Type II toxin-antitoxin system RelE/ParE family toxin n=1 Tax=Marinobacterium aestuariivivens TaxID=1698799 RepID=A0ABW1ZUC3_9GAMM
MASIIWTEPALDQLNDIAEYIALENPGAAQRLVASVFDKVSRLEHFPQSGRKPPELPDTDYREILVPPCRIFYRHDESKVLILHVMREERDLRRFMLNAKS